MHRCIELSSLFLRQHAETRVGTHRSWRARGAHLRSCTDAVPATQQSPAAPQAAASPERHAFQPSLPGPRGGRTGGRRRLLSIHLQRVLLIQRHAQVPGPRHNAAAPQASPPQCANITDCTVPAKLRSSTHGQQQEGLQQGLHLRSQAHIGVVRCEVKKKCPRALTMRG